VSTRLGQAGYLGSPAGPLLHEWSVDGDPVPQGNHRIVPTAFGGRIYDANSARDATGRLDVWRQQIALSVRTFRRGLGPIEDPVVVFVTFRLRRPKRSTFRVPATHPDLDKLQRAIGDALTQGGLIRDDGRIVRWVAEKVYAERAGADLAIARISGTD
jgi:Holliday junction resolvase RusA-like endonuclease